ncbi:ERF family protein [Streptomyces sp. KR2]|uniref:ERF family protein n=1 Tax=Streptomyces sp. KR2 TaxID=1514824 RepID=UPI003F7D7AB2
MTVTALPLSPQATPQPAMSTVAPVYQPAPAGAPDDVPRVFAAISGVMRDAMPVGKTQENKQQNYKFRGIDDVMSAMAGPLRKHGVFILPTVAEHQQQRDGKMTRTLITMRYSIYGPAGDCLIAEVPGEAFDFADKSMNKAQSAALKYLLFTLFMLPVDGRSIDDGDRHHPEPQEQRAEQPQRQQRRQDKQQSRRGQRAEPGTPTRPQAQQQAPRRDFLAEATAAATAAAVRELYDAAKAEGAPRPYLSQLAEIGATKPGAKQPATDEAPSSSEPAPDSAALAADAADAEQALRIAASRANLTSLDADFARVYGRPIEGATAQQLDQFRAKIEAAGGAK